MRNSLGEPLRYLASSGPNVPHKEVKQRRLIELCHRVMLSLAHRVERQDLIDGELVK